MTLLLIVFLSSAMFLPRPQGANTSTRVLASAYVATVGLEKAVRLRLDEVRWSEMDFKVSVSRFDDAVIPLKEPRFAELSNLHLLKAIDAVKRVPRGGQFEVYAAVDALERLEQFTYEAWLNVDAAALEYARKAQAQVMAAYLLSLGSVLVVGLLLAGLAFGATRTRNHHRTLLSRYAALQAAASELQIRSAHVLKSKNEFLAMVSHELRSPLQTLLSSIQLLEEPGADMSRIMPRLKRSSLALDTQLGDLLSLAKADRVNFETGPIAVSALVNRACLSHWATAQTKGLRLNANASKSTWIVDTCGVRLFQVLDNLISNAVRYTPKGIITVSVGVINSLSSSLSLQVKDTGYGIKPEDLHRIFLPFSRFHVQFDAPETASRSRKGGMGLAIVKALLDGIGGTIKVESVVGEGTTFTVSVPCRPLSPATLRSRSETCVLVVDDEPDILAAISDILSLEHVDVRTAMSVAQGLRAWETNRPLLILMDLNLPDGNGRHAAQMIRDACVSDSSLMRPVIVAMSAAVSKDAVADGVFDGFLAKPIDASQLKHLISSLSFDEVLR